jgi:deoxyribose-phosphate aldolase|tara:strand:- start:650 stop:1390 length:741 start_codon:yes stop_codon:yes gene_type:complete
MNLGDYLDSTYLKTDGQAQISNIETKRNVIALIEEAITNDFKLVMIRQEYISVAKRLIADAKSNVLVGTVIGFHEGTNAINQKLEEAENAIKCNVDELDFVVNYKAFVSGKTELVEEEIYLGTKLALENNKIIKWIIEIAALTNAQIVSIAQLIKRVVVDNFGVENAPKVFIKSSTGFYKTEEGKPNGATFEAMKLIVENANPLQSKAAGGVKTFSDAIKMIEIGVTRIGTSSARKIIDRKLTEGY